MSLQADARGRLHLGAEVCEVSDDLQNLLKDFVPVGRAEALQDREEQCLQLREHGLHTRHAIQDAGDRPQAPVHCHATLIISVCRFLDHN